MSQYSRYQDHQLIDLLANDDSAFTALYHRYWKLLFSVAANQLHNPAEAEELVQDLFLDLWNRRHTLKINNAVSSYLSVAVNYRVLNILAKRHRRHQYLQSLNNDAADHSTEHYLRFEEVKKRLEGLVSELPKKCKLVFQLSRQESLTRREIASLLRISEKTVESHLTRALQHIRTKMGSFFILLHFF